MLLHAKATNEHATIFNLIVFSSADLRRMNSITSNRGNIEHGGLRRDEFSLTVADLHHRRRIRHEAVEPIACHTVCRPKGGSSCAGYPPSIATT